MTLDLPRLIARVESADNQWAMRSEQHVFERRKFNSALMDVTVKANRCSRYTARWILSTSWGLYQIMGFNLYGFLGWKKPVGELLASSFEQCNLFMHYCDTNGIWRAGDPREADDVWLLRFATAYNGPGAPLVYRGRMKEVMEQLTKELEQ